MVQKSADCVGKNKVVQHGLTLTNLDESLYNHNFDTLIVA